MLDGLTIPTDLSAAALLAIVVLLVVLGRLIPIRTHDRELADKDTQIADWKAAHSAEVERSQVLAENLGELMELARTTVRIVEAIPRARDTAS